MLCEALTNNTHAGCTGTQSFASVQLTNLGNNGANGPTSVNGYITSPCPDSRAQLVNSGTIAISTGGVQRFTVPVTGNYRLDVAGKGNLRL